MENLKEKWEICSMLFMFFIILHLKLEGKKDIKRKD